MKIREWFVALPRCYLNDTVRGRGSFIVQNDIASALPGLVQVHDGGGSDAAGHRSETGRGRAHVADAGSVTYRGCVGFVVVDHVIFVIGNQQLFLLGYRRPWALER